MVLDDYDGAAAIAAGWADGLRPDPSLTVSAWADRHRVLSPRGANEAGPWRTARTPYLNEIMDHLSPSHPCQRVVFMKGAQTGGTEAGNNFLGYVIHHAPGPILAVQPTVEPAKRFSQQPVEPLIEASPMLRERIAPARSRDSGNTVLSKTFTGGKLPRPAARSLITYRIALRRTGVVAAVSGPALSSDWMRAPIWRSRPHSSMLFHSSAILPFSKR